MSVPRRSTGLHEDVGGAPPRGSLPASAAKAVAQFDSTGLCYTLRDGQLYVSYPHRSDGDVAYGTGFVVGPVPPMYWTDPPNAITRERAGLWAVLIANAAPL